MALDVRGSLANVYASLDRYLLATIAAAPPDGAGIALQLHGVRQFIPPIDDPWVQVFYNFIGLQSQYFHLANNTQYAREPQGYLQFNVYQRARVWSTRYTTAAARDAVVNAFPEGKILSIYDYSDPNTDMPQECGYFHIDETKEHVTDWGLRSGVTQHVIQVATRYFEYFTR